MGPAPPFDLQVSCISSGPSPAAVALRSPSSNYALQVSQQDAALRLVNASGSPIWAPQGALAGSPPAQLCITSAGQLKLTGAGSSSLWSSSYANGPASSGPFTAFVTDDGCLEVVDGRCSPLYSSHSSGGKAVGGAGAVQPPPKPSTWLANFPQGASIAVLPPRRPPPKGPSSSLGSVGQFTRVPPPPASRQQRAKRPPLRQSPPRRPPPNRKPKQIKGKSLNKLRP
jgi:hypothetical protein